METSKGHSKVYKDSVPRLFTQLTLRLAPDPFYYGPGPARVIARVRVGLLAASLLAGASAVTLPAPWSTVLALLAAFTLFVAATVPRIWRSFLAAMVDRETPAVISFMLPFAAVTGYVADLLVEAGRSGFFRWMRYESARMKLLMDSGMDPVAALKTLVETTPSKALRQALIDYVYAQRVGASRSNITLLLLRSALDSVRSQWRGYYELARNVADLTVTAIVGVMLVAPMAMMAGEARAAVLAAAAPVFIAPLSAALLLAARPSLGDSKPPLHVVAGFHVAPLALAVATLLLGPWRALALGVVVAAALEVAAARLARREEEALASIRMAAEAARYGQDYMSHLSRAESLATGVVKAIVEASRRAGRMGVGEALEYIHRVVLEARSHAAGLRGPAVALALIAVITPPIILGIAALMDRVAEGANQLVGIAAGVTEEVAPLVVASSPLLALPASVLLRPWTPSLVPPLLSLATAAAAAEWAPRIAAVIG